MFNICGAALRTLRKGDDATALWLLRGIHALMNSLTTGANAGQPVRSRTNATVGNRRDPIRTYLMLPPCVAPVEMCPRVTVFPPRKKQRPELVRCTLDRWKCTVRIRRIQPNLSFRAVSGEAGRVSRNLLRDSNQGSSLEACRGRDFSTRRLGALFEMTSFPICDSWQAKWSSERNNQHQS